MDEIERKLEEFRVLTGRLRRYWKKLVIESLRIARDRGLVTGVVQYSANSPYDITLDRQGDNVDVTELIDLAESRFPSLYRKYREGIARHNVIISKLGSFLDNL